MKPKKLWEAFLVLACPICAKIITSFAGNLCILQYYTMFTTSKQSDFVNKHNGATHSASLHGSAECAAPGFLMPLA